MPRKNQKNKPQKSDLCLLLISLGKLLGFLAFELLSMKFTNMLVRRDLPVEFGIKFLSSGAPTSGLFILDSYLCRCDRRFFLGCAGGKWSMLRSGIGKSGENENNRAC